MDDLALGIQTEVCGDLHAHPKCAKCFPAFQLTLLHQIQRGFEEARGLKLFRCNGKWRAQPPHLRVPASQTSQLTVSAKYRAQDLLSSSHFAIF